MKTALLALALFAINVSAAPIAAKTDQAHAVTTCKALPTKVLREACAANIAGSLKALRVPAPKTARATTAQRGVAAPDVLLEPGQTSVTIRFADGGVVLPPPVDPPVIPPGAQTCAGTGKTLNIPLDWANPNVRVLTSAYGGFGRDDVVVVQFTTGSVSSTNNLPNVTAVEYGSSPSARTATLSSKACDFGPQPAYGATIAGNTVTAVFAVGTGSGYGFYPVLQTNTTYFLNIKNNPDAGCSASGMCDMAIAMTKSAGL